VTPVATYSFLPWLRQGVANTIASADGDPAVTTRAQVQVELLLSGDPVQGDTPLTLPLGRTIALYGPGDIVGIDARAVVRTEPRHLVGNFESNFLPAIDFYDEDFPWRYTPAAPDASRLRLRPWITLVVLAEHEFEEGRSLAGRPLPFVTIADTAVLPAADELWAWAHVHFNESLSSGPEELVSPDMSAVLPRIAAIVARNRDAAYSRLVCPRRLDDNTDYHAFVVPTFETGRLAGLGLDPAGAPHATASAWEPYAGRADATSYPVYYRWFFRTGSRGDFEFLVRLLEPRPVDKRVGARDMDVQDPAPNIPGILDPELGGILRLGGALRVPDADLDEDDLAERRKYENWDQPYPHPFQRALAAFVDLADDYAERSALDANTASGLADDDPDPLITSPLYGRWHALTQRLLTRRDGTPAPNDTNWVHRLNLDPGFRVPAAFGTGVIQANDEQYMDDAWQQIGDVLDANARIRRLHLAADVSLRWYDRYVTPLAAADSEHAFAIAAPVAGRVLVEGSALAHLQTASLVPPTLTSTAMRRALRPQARLMRALPFDTTVQPGNLLARVNAAQVSAAPPKVVPPGAPTVDQAAAAAEPPFPWLLVGAIAIAIVVLLVLAIVVAPAIGVLALVALVGLVLLLRRWQRAQARAGSLSEAGQTPAAVDRLAHSPDFVLSEPGSNVRPKAGAVDSPTAVRFKGALRDSFALRVASDTVAERPIPTTLDLPVLTTSVVTAVDPTVTVPRRGFSTIAIPPFISDLVDDQFAEIMAYPRIDLPMYEPLKAISAELFLPNIDLIAQNSITLIETNQRFIEAYMVGLNHEFARELLWREYPTDQRGSYFRQFWDVRSVINSEGRSEDALREQLYDIPELHTWLPESDLGQHNQRAAPDQKDAQAVLVIRGELLKKYPTAVIYAHRADWARNADGSIDLSEPRELVRLEPAEEQQPPRDKVRSPLYEAKADPDIYFFGFDLTIPEVIGGSGEPPNDDPGWFFVIKERPGEPRFGLDLEREGALEVFDDLTWDDALPSTAPGQFLPATSLASVALAPLPPGDPEGKQPQRDDDLQVDPASISAARWAYLLFRAPVMVAIHASEMLGTGS
jgi:hypothetical protein